MWSLAVRAQQTAMPVVGFLNAASARDHARPLSAFINGLNQTGYVEWPERAHRISLGGWKKRSTASDGSRFSSARRGRNRSNDYSGSTCRKGGDKRPSRSFLKSAKDPIKLGLVASLNQPGGNAYRCNPIERGGRAEAT